MLRPPSFGRPAMIAATVVSVAMFAILVMGGYTRHERAEGLLLPGTGVVDVTSHQEGLVTRVLVREGQHVAAGTLLADISGERESTVDGGTRQRVVETLTTKRDRLIADIADQRLVGELKARGLRERIDFLSREIGHVSTQIDLQESRVNSAAEIYGHWQQAGKTGAVSGLQMLQQKDTMLQNQAQAADLHRQRLVLDQQRAQATVELAQAPVDTRNELNGIERELSDVSAQIAENEVIRSLILRSPIDGFVSNVTAYTGQPVGPHDVLLSIVPEQRNVRAQLWLESRSVGFVHPGVKVMVRYDAFPDRRLAPQSGHVLSVSGSALPAAEVSRLVGHAVEQPRYQVLVELDGRSPAGEHGHLLPGMTLSADILLGHRSFADWIKEVFEHERFVSVDPNVALPCSSVVVGARDRSLV